MAGAHQIRGDGRAHITQSYETNFQSNLLYFRKLAREPDVIARRPVELAGMAVTGIDGCGDRARRPAIADRDHRGDARLREPPGFIAQFRRQCVVRHTRGDGNHRRSVIIARAGMSASSQSRPSM
jgi:hypothetical protein